MDTTQEGVSAPATPESQFQSLWDAGAFEPQKPEDRTQQTQQQTQAADGQQAQVTPEHQAATTQAEGQNSDGKGAA